MLLPRCMEEADTRRNSGYIGRWFGAVAQLGERCVRNAEVGSSILLGSTKSCLHFNCLHLVHPITAILCERLCENRVSCNP